MVKQKMPIETANFIGFNHTLTPTNWRLSKDIETKQQTARKQLKTPIFIKKGCVCQSF